MQPPNGNQKTVAYSPEGGIVWQGVLRTGIAEAKRTNRPILLLSAAPNCHGISGIW